MKRLIGLWVLKGFTHGRSGEHPISKKPIYTRIFFTYAAVEKFKDKASVKYREIYPDYCITLKKIFGNIVRF